MYSNINIVNGKVFFSYFKNSKRIDTYTEFNPVLFIKDCNGNYAGEDGKKLKKLIIPLKDYYNITNNENRKNYFYGEINPIYQFIQKIWGNFQFKPQYFKLFKIFCIDIEVFSYDGIPDVNKVDYEISSISIKDFSKDMVYVISFLNYDSNKSILNMDKSRILYKKCDNEVDLLKTFVFILSKTKPDILTGWNIEFFDLPYLYNRISKVLGESYLKKSSPYEILRRVIKNNYNDVVSYKDPLIPYLDYFSLYKTYTERKRAIALNNVCLEELELEKLEYDGDLNELARKDPQRYVDYNIWDSELVYLLDKKLRLIELALNIMYRTKTTHQDVFRSTRLWDVLIYNELKKQNKEIIPLPVIDVFERIKGAHVFNTVKGKHENIVVYDINSLYPNIVIGANISKMSLIEDAPEELIQYRNSINKNIDNVITGEYKDLLKYLKKYNYCYTPNGQFWERGKQSNISKIMEDIYNERIDVQRRMKTIKNKESLDRNQYALKILLNAGYGVFACEYFRYKDTRVGEAITTTGQLIIKYVYNEIEKKLKDDVYIIGGDTDSIFISLTPYISRLNIKDKEEKIKKIIEFSNENIAQLLNDIFSKISKKLNFFKSPLKMKLEYVADRGIYRAKKNYLVRKVTDGETILEKEKMNPKGLEMIRSSIPFYIRKKLLSFLSLILDEKLDVLDNELDKLRKEFEQLNVDDIALSKTTTDITKCFCNYDDKLYEKSTPIHIRAAILYNHLIEKNNLKLKKATDNGRIHYVHMKLPNILNENVLGFVDRSIFDVLNLKQYIDYNAQFEKVVLSILTKLTMFYNKDLTKDKSFYLTDIDSLFN